jgi:hypothetical protein
MVCVEGLVVSQEWVDGEELVFESAEWQVVPHTAAQALVTAFAAIFVHIRVLAQPIEGFGAAFDRGGSNQLRVFPLGCPVWFPFLYD